MKYKGRKPSKNIEDRRGKPIVGSQRAIITTKETKNNSGFMDFEYDEREFGKLHPSSGLPFELLESSPKPVTPKKREPRVPVFDKLVEAVDQAGEDIKKGTYQGPRMPPPDKPRSTRKQDKPTKEDALLEKRIKESLQEALDKLKR